MKFCALDAHSQHCELAVVSEKGKVISCRNLVTSEKELLMTLRAVVGPKKLVFEEGPLAHWLAQLLRPYVDELIVADPKKNRWISHNEKKSDRVDAVELAQLLRLGSIRSVFHSQDEAWVKFRQLVQHQRDLVRHMVRTKNQLKAHMRSVAVSCPGNALYQAVDSDAQLAEWLDRIDAYPQLQMEVNHLVRLLACQFELIKQTEAKMEKQSRQWPIIAQWQKLPGVGLITAATVAAIVVTPLRFAHDGKLTSYAGLSIMQQESGGKVLRRRASHGGNRDLKRVLMQAARCVGNSKKTTHPVVNYYRGLLARGLPDAAVRRAVARKLLSVMYGQWKRALVTQPQPSVAA